MKNILSCSGIAALGLSLMLGSCVSNKKYAEAQAAIERYRQDSAACASRTASIQQNLSSLEQSNRSMKTQMDSSRQHATRYQKRWDEFQSYYAQQTKSSEEFRGQLTSSLSSAGLSEENIQASNGNVIITLPEDNLFSSGSNLSSKGKSTLEKIASAIQSKDDYSVVVTTDASFASSPRLGKMNKNKMKGEGRDKQMSDSSMDQSAGSDTSMAAHKEGKDSAMASKKSGKKQKRAQTSDDKWQKEEGTSTSRRGGTANWSTDFSRASAIVKALSQNGVNDVRLIAPRSSGSEEQGYFVVLTPKMNRMHQMFQGDDRSQSENDNQNKMKGQKNKSVNSANNNNNNNQSQNSGVNSPSQSSGNNDQDSSDKK